MSNSLPLHQSVLSKPLRVKMGPRGDESWGEYMDRLQKEGYRPRTADECQEESSHATLVVMPCSCRGWEHTEPMANLPIDKAELLPCRRCRCGRQHQHTEGCFKDEESQAILV